LNQDHEFRDRELAIGARRLQHQEKLAQAQLQQQLAIVQRKSEGADLLALMKAYREDGCKPSIARRKAKNVLAGRESDEDEDGVLPPL
jgi:hypothetical protein